MVLAKELLILAALYRDEVVADSILIPVLHRIWTVGLGEFGLCWACKRLGLGVGEVRDSPGGGQARLHGVVGQARRVDGARKGGFRCEHDDGAGCCNVVLRLYRLGVTTDSVYIALSFRGLAKMRKGKLLLHQAA